MPKLNTKTLTDKFISSAKAKGGRRTEYRDAQVPGLCLRVEPTGAKAWVYRYSRAVDGKKKDHRVTLRPDDETAPASNPPLSLADARLKATALRLRVMGGGNPATEAALAAKARREAPTFREIGEMYIEQHAKAHKRSWQQDEDRLERSIYPTIGDLKACEVTARDIKAMRDAVFERGAPVESNRALALVKVVYAWAIEELLVIDSPAHVVKRRHKETERERVLSHKEIRKFWTRLDGAPMSPATRLALRIALTTAQRIGPICKAEVAELDFDKNLWTVPPNKMKSGRAHLVPLSPLAADMFKRAIAARRKPREGEKASAYVFPSLNGEPLDKHATATAMRRSLKHLKIEPATPHDLRRTAATQMAEMGVSRFDIGQVLAHDDGSRTATRIYDRHSYLPEKRKALDAWALRLALIIEGKPIDADNVVPMTAAAGVA